MASASTPRSSQEHAAFTALVSPTLNRHTPSARCARIRLSPRLSAGTGTEAPVDVGPFKVMPLAVGTWAWGNRLLYNYSTNRDDDLKQAFGVCVSRGVNFFDTGDSYGTGRLNARAEVLLGEFARERRQDSADDLVLATKLASYPWRVTPQSVEDACRRSAARLGRDAVDLAQIHWSTVKYAPWQERVLWEGFARLHEKGLARAVGVSNYGPRQLRRIAEFMSERGVPLVSNQFQCSLLARTPLESGLIDTCRELGIQPIGYSPLSLGLLSGKYSDPDALLPSGVRGLLFRQLRDSAGDLLMTLSAVAEERGLTPAQVAINWSLGKGLVTLVGCRDRAQAEGNVAAMGWRLSNGEVVELEKAAKRSKKQMVENIFQTE